MAHGTIAVIMLGCSTTWSEPDREHCPNGCRHRDLIQEVARRRDWICLRCLTRSGESSLCPGEGSRREASLRILANAEEARRLKLDADRLAMVAEAEVIHRMTSDEFAAYLTVKAADAGAAAREADMAVRSRKFRPHGKPHENKRGPRRRPGPLAEDDDNR